MSLIKTKNLFKIYNEGKSNECKAIAGIDLSIDKGDFIAIVGKSGSGKTTLAHLLSCIIVPTNGEIIIDGKNINCLNKKKQAEYRNKIVGIIFQDFFLINELTVINNVILPTFFKKKNETINKGLDLLKIVGLENKTKEKVAVLSGGEKQRVAIARALINEPDILIADEPSGNLDSKSRNEIIDLLAKINKKGTTVIIVTHDKEIAERCNRIVSLEDGRIVADTAVMV